MVIQVSGTCQLWSWITSKETLSNGRNWLVFLLLLLFMTDTRLRGNKTQENPTYRPSKFSNLWNGILYKTMWCCSEHSGEQIWKAESPRGKLNEVSQPLSFDHFLSYFLNFIKCWKSTAKLLICNQTRRSMWQQVIHLKFSKGKSVSFSTIKMRTGLNWSCFESGYLE